MKYLIALILFSACGQTGDEKVYLHRPHLIKIENMDSSTVEPFAIHGKDGKMLIEANRVGNSMWLAGDLMDTVTKFDRLVINGYEYDRRFPIHKDEFGSENSVRYGPDSIATITGKVVELPQFTIDDYWVSVPIDGKSYRMQPDNVHPKEPHTHTNINNPDGRFYICKKNTKTQKR